MGEPKNGDCGFSSTQPTSTPNQQITRNSTDHSAKEQQALALINQGRLQEAEEIYKALIAAGTRNHIVYCNLAALCGMQGKPDAAIHLLQKTLELQPNHPETHNNLGNALKERGDLSAAIACYSKAVTLKPNFQEAHNNLGNALKEQGNHTAAIAAYNKALALKPDSPETHHSRGLSLKKNGDRKSAIKAYKQAIALNPNYRDAHTNLGVALQEEGRLDEAIEALSTAFHLDTNHSLTQWNLSLALLMSGNYKQGWLHYEARQSIWAHNSQIVLPNEQRWSHESTAQPTHVLLVSEQGLGDTLQFMRYVLELRNRGISTSLCAPTKLHSLIQASGIDAAPVSREGTEINGHTTWLPLLSLPGRLGVSPNNPIITKPYIKTTDALATKWGHLLSGERRPIIGINWQGDQNTEKASLKGRSLALETFAPIARRTSSTLLSLQKGFGSEQLEACSFRDHFASCQPLVDETWDFLETAAIIENCDLVITSDTAVAHLAGGMGKTTWLLLHTGPDWRWGLNGTTSFWYPSLRLFRQRERGNWDEVIQRVAHTLQQEFPGIATAHRVSSQAEPFPCHGV